MNPYIVRATFWTLPLVTCEDASANTKPSTEFFSAPGTAGGMDLNIVRYVYFATSSGGGVGTSRPRCKARQDWNPRDRYRQQQPSAIPGKIMLGFSKIPSSMMLYKA